MKQEGFYPEHVPSDLLKRIALQSHESAKRFTSQGQPSIV